MNACQHCEKSFKTAPALKGHITKTHKNEVVDLPPTQPVETSQQETAVTEFDDEIDFDLS